MEIFRATIDKEILRKLCMDIKIKKMKAMDN